MTRLTWPYWQHSWPDPCPLNRPLSRENFRFPAAAGRGTTNFQNPVEVCVLLLWHVFGRSVRTNRISKSYSSRNIRCRRFFFFSPSRWLWPWSFPGPCARSLASSRGGILATLYRTATVKSFPTFPFLCMLTFASKWLTDEL